MNLSRGVPITIAAAAAAAAAAFATTTGTAHSSIAGLRLNRLGILVTLRRFIRDFNKCLVIACECGVTPPHGLPVVIPYRSQSKPSSHPAVYPRTWSSHAVYPGGRVGCGGQITWRGKGSMG
eukprot:1892990-Pyramimonas_sp.AAC.1